MSQPSDVASAMDAFVRTAERDRLGVEGVVVTGADGHPHQRRLTPDVRRDVFSVSKTVMALAVGIAEDQGLLHLDDPVLRHVPEMASYAAPGVEEVTLRHLLSMTAGNDFRWLHPDADFPGDPLEAFLAAPLVARPGTRYRYAGGNTYALSRVVLSATGSDVRDFLVPRLFEPLGIRNPQWLRCPLGVPLGAVGLQLRTSEIDRIAQLLLHDGAHQGRQLVPAEHLLSMRTELTATGRPEPDDREYGLHVWNCARDGAWRMDGIYGQFGIVLPEHGATVSITAHYGGPTTDILDAAWNELVPALVSASSS